MVGFWTPITPNSGLLFHADAQPLIPGGHFLCQSPEEIGLRAAGAAVDALQGFLSSGR
jgi:hypothetical protein